MKVGDTAKLMAILVIAMVIAGGAVFFAVGDGKASTTEEGIVDVETGAIVGPWANKLVNYQLVVSNEFTGGDVAAVAKVYDVQPADWNNPRGDFDDAALYTTYTATDGVVTVNKEVPGTYYAVMTASGYNTEFVIITIPDGVGRGDISDYQSNPDRKLAEMSTLGTTVDEDFALTLVNDTSAEVRETVILTVADNTKFKGWKAIINDQEGFSLDTDGDGIYDEGISSFKVSVAGVEKIIFNPNKGADLFDSNDEYTMSLDGVVLSDAADLVVKIDIAARTSDYIGANDEVWGEGEGVLSYIKIYDKEGNLFTTVDVTA